MGTRRPKFFLHKPSRDLDLQPHVIKPKPHHLRTGSSAKLIPGPNRAQLIAALKLRYDPFQHRVTEQELGQNFAEIYVEPVESLLIRLQEACSSFVFADNGMGKSATRLALEYTLRLFPDIAAPTLCVRYEPDFIDAATQATHLRGIQTAIATDIVIQTFERYMTGLIEFDDRMIAALQRQAAILPAQLRASRLRAAQEAPPQDGIFWDTTLRPMVEPLNTGARWRELLDIIAKAKQRSAYKRQSWHDTLKDIKTLGFTNIYVLIDAVDEKKVDPLDWLAFLAPLLNTLADLQDQRVFLKCFLPAQVEQSFRRQYERKLNLLTLSPEFTTIALTSTDLKHILERRIQAAKHHVSRVITLDLLAGSGIDESIEAWLVQEADGSPRKLLKYVSKLLDFHTEHGFQRNRRLHLTREEWSAFKSLVHHQNDGS